jgi:uncharacterized protein (DUF924 family)
MYQEIIEFWFNETDQTKWFKKDPAFDELMCRRFANVHAQAIRCELFSWRTTALGSLAEIVVLDQFSRNMFRDKPESFAYDEIALVLAQTAIFHGFDGQLPPEKRAFLYMPFMHSESLLIHAEAVKLFTQLGAKTNLEYEMRHKAIIERFGRYPHRNKILGRISTPDELEFLLEPGSSF